jgi:type II secretory pathway pseudopilin PulG
MKRCTTAGFSLIEVLVAAAVFVTGIIAVFQLFIAAQAANRSAHGATGTTVLAAQKMEQLRSLTWGFDVAGTPVSDTTTDISVMPFTSAGNGLAPSPPGSLQQNTTGYADYLDQWGSWVGGGSAIPDGAVYIRKWSIEPLPTDPANTLLLQVLVTRHRDRGSADRDRVARLPDEARLATMRTRIWR